MSLPPLDRWTRSIRDLHKAGRLLGALRALLLDHVPGYLELALRVVPEGLTTETLPRGSSVTLDMRSSAVTITTLDGTMMIPLAGSTQAEILTTIIEALRPFELSTDAGLSVDAFLMTVSARPGAPADPRADLADTTPLDIDPKTARDYASVQYRIYSGLMRLRSSLKGSQAPLVVWPEHFDLSGLWFVGAGVDDHRDPHINIGFAPYSPGFERPYLYAYGYPLKEGYSAPTLPAPAYWYSDKWTGAVVQYDHMDDELDTFVEEIAASIFNELRPLLRE
jgi:hypothetical protein